MPKEEAGVRRLIVGHVLPGDGETVLRVVHQSSETVLGRNRGGEDAKFFVVRRAEDDFFAPIAEEISAESRRRFGAVVGDATLRGEDVFKRGAFVVPL